MKRLQAATVHPTLPSQAKVYGGRRPGPPPQGTKKTKKAISHKRGPPGLGATRGMPRKRRPHQWKDATRRPMQRYTTHCHFPTGTTKGHNGSQVSGKRALAPRGCQIRGPGVYYDHRVHASKTPGPQQEGSNTAASNCPTDRAHLPGLYPISGKAAEAPKRDCNIPQAGVG
ncbi:Hypothetical predicted protein [Pelobates cultripes]|uniref:Uncharacterized protein n=1 Tax=Pelobates cultripes TaxID=61616 RepID=A0AAD1S7X1_PELCU|nr:Hypothetical predicted protein [Pelobates cultripes]